MFDGTSAENNLFTRFSNDGRMVQRLSIERRRTRDNVKEKIEWNEYAHIRISCPFCKMQESRLIASKERHALPTEVVICRNCSLVYNRTRLDLNSLIHFYENYCYSLDRGDFPVKEYLKSEYLKGEIIFNLLANLNLLGLIREKIILDIRCGGGSILKKMTDAGFVIFGCEFSQELINFAREENRLTCIRGGVQELFEFLGPEVGQVGLVIYEQVLEHVHDIYEELSILQTNVAVGSLVYVGVPWIKYTENSYEADFLSYLEIDHLVHFTATTLDNFMVQYGFKKIFGNEIIQAVYIRTDDTVHSIGTNNVEVIDFLIEMENKYLLKKKSFLNDAGRKIVRKMQKIISGKY